MNFLSDMNAANYMMSNKQKLMLIMLVDGEHWRARNQQIFQYRSGAWAGAGKGSSGLWQTTLKRSRVIHRPGAGLLFPPRPLRCYWSTALTPSLSSGARPRKTVTICARRRQAIKHGRLFGSGVSPICSQHFGVSGTRPRHILSPSFSSSNGICLCQGPMECPSQMSFWTHIGRKLPSIRLRTAYCDFV